MKRLALSLALALATAWPAAAAEKAYDFDPAHTQVSFTVDRFGFTNILGVFAQTQGTVWLDEEHPERSRVEATVTTDSLWTSDATRDTHVKSPRWLNGAAYPRMSFKSTKVELTGKDTARVTGDLTIGAVTRPVVLTVKLNKLGQNPASPRRTAGFTLNGEISRKDFGLVTAPGLIGDLVQIHIEALALERAA